MVREDKKIDGIVYLVGSGPGDPGLLTIKAAEKIAEADVQVLVLTILILHRGLMNDQVVLHHHAEVQIATVLQQEAIRVVEAVNLVAVLRDRAIAEDLLLEVPAQVEALHRVVVQVVDAEGNI